MNAGHPSGSRVFHRRRIAGAPQIQQFRTLCFTFRLSARFTATGSKRHTPPALDAGINPLLTLFAMVTGFSWSSAASWADVSNAFGSNCAIFVGLGGFTVKFYHAIFTNHY
jgi:hypothetical protein